MNPILRSGSALLLTAVVSATSVMTGCKSSAPVVPDASQATQAAAPAAAPAQPTAVAAPLQMSVDDVVAPIALYPDQLLTQLLTASTNSQEVLDGGNWLLQNQNLKGDALTAAAKQAGFSPSMQYLMSFPQVVDNMCQQIDWTKTLGANFQSDPKGVMDAIQRKRAQAQQTGNLTSSPHMTVDTKKADNGQQYIEIQPANPQVVYVPQYNPVTIYNTPAPAPAPVATTTTATSTASSGVSTGTAVMIGLLSFGVGMAVGSAINNNNNYYPYPSWGYGNVYYGGHPYYPPPYRPVYPGYRPAYGYHPPPNYHWNQYNNNVNIKVNNNNYYGRYHNNTVNRNPNTLPANANNGGNRPVQQPSWKGQSGYQGAHPNTANQKPGSSMANANPRNPQAPNRGNTPNQLPGSSMANANPANKQGANRPAQGNNAGANNRLGQGENSAKTGAMNRPGNAGGNMNRPAPGNANRPAATPANANRGGDRGYGNSAARPAQPAARPAPQQQSKPSGGNDGAFNRGGSAKSERSASSRGQSSMGAPKGRKH